MSDLKSLTLGSAPNESSYGYHKSDKKSEAHCAEHISAMHVDFTILMWRDVARPPIERREVESPGKPHQKQKRAQPQQPSFEVGRHSSIKFIKNGKGLRP